MFQARVRVFRGKPRLTALLSASLCLAAWFGVPGLAVAADIGQASAGLKLTTPASAVGAVPLSSGAGLAFSSKPDVKSFFTIDVPEGAGTLTVTLEGANGEPDLYISAPGKPVSMGHHDCLSAAQGSHETCTFYNPAPGRYTALVYDGYKGFTASTITATYTMGAYVGPEATALAPAQPVLVSGRKGSEQLYKIEVPAGLSRMIVGTADGSGDVSLAMLYQRMPDIAANPCSDYGDTVAVCDQNFPTPGTWYVKVHGDKAFSSVALTATFSTPGPLTPLANGVTLPGLSGQCCEMAYYPIVVPEGAGKLTVKTGGDRSGDATLFVSYGEVPKWWVYDCASDNFGEAETCVIPTPRAGTYYVGLHTNFGYADVPLTATYEMGGGGYIGPDCPAGSVQHTGTLYRGEAAHFPFRSSGSRAGAKLLVPTAADVAKADFPFDFDLYLERRTKSGWEVVSSSASTSRDHEKLGLASAPAGALRWTVTAFEGSGSYRLCSRVE